MTTGRLWIGLALAMAVATGPRAGAQPDVRDAIVKIYTVHNRPNYYNPWTTYGPRSSTGSGAIVKGKKILTNAHVVGNQTFLQVRRNGESKRYQAHLLAVSHEADLALLTVDDESFFEGIEPLEFGPLPNTQQEVLVYGFPLGGDSMSITKGVLSRIEHQRYAHSSCNFLAGQIDAAINPGNSGGPVIVSNRVVGVVMQGMTSAENIGYMVPIEPVAHHFFKDIEDGTYDGFPSMGAVMQEMENPSLKARFNVPEDETGVLINMILPDSPADGVLQDGDVLVQIDGQDVAEDGTVEFRPEQRTKLSYFIQKRQIGETLPIRILRDGEALAKEVTLDRSLREDWLIQEEAYDVLPTYYIYGGVLFCPLSKNLLKEWGNNWYNAAPKEFVAMLGSNFSTEEQDEVVIVLKVLAAGVNQGYHNVSNWIVDEVDGEKIRNLKDLIARIEGGTGRFVELTSPTGQQLVLDRAEVTSSQDTILNLYRINKDRSPDLLGDEAL